MLEYKRETIRGFLVICWWCDDEFYTEFGRFKHLLEEHPRFLDEFGELNEGTWLPWKMTVPDQLDDLDSEGDSDAI